MLETRCEADLRTRPEGNRRSCLSAPRRSDLAQFDDALKTALSRCCLECRYKPSVDAGHQFKGNSGHLALKLLGVATRHGTDSKAQRLPEPAMSASRPLVRGRRASARAFISASRCCRQFIGGGGGMAITALRARVSAPEMNSWQPANIRLLLRSAMLKSGSERSRRSGTHRFRSSTTSSSPFSDLRAAERRHCCG